jgi:hypothetical protein
MSDTVKLIIEMPEETYKGIMLGKWDDNGLAFYVKTGTPLDDVKAEIAKHHDIHLGELKSRSNVGILMFGGDAYDRGIKHAIEILDNIGKESEDT